MRSLVARLTAGVVAALLAIPLAAAPAAAAPIPSGCKSSSLPGAAIGWYPANPGSQSALQVSCRFDASTGSAMVANAFTIHDAGLAQFHNGAARTVTSNGSSIAAGATTFTLASCVGITGYVNRPISRNPFPNPPAADTVQLAARTFVKSISAGCVVTLSQPTVATAGPARIKTALQLQGEVRLNEDRTVHVVPRLTGLVESVSFNVGDRVRRGQVLAVVSRTRWVVECARPAT